MPVGPHVDGELQRPDPVGLLMDAGDYTRLELSVETLRALNEDELARVNGGSPTFPTTSVAITGAIGPPTGTLRCPSGDTWTARCEI